MTFIAPHYNKAKKKTLLSYFKQDRFFVKTPWWLKKLYPNCLWDMPQKEKTLYLTFDDGPHPTITPFVLAQLKKHNAKGTFFCIGHNVAKYAAVYKQLLDEGHVVGNHTQHHINGWKTEDVVYLRDIEQASALISSPLFRPPYGRISRSQISKLREGAAPLTIVMWNILAGDWIQELSPEKCYSRISRKIQPGDIIVFHDSEKAWERMSYCLPLLLQHYSDRGYRFEAIS
jgi:peptidoglycan/xylan/chitin deacetylase (PgdA/CDA1 family)